MTRKNEHARVAKPLAVTSLKDWKELREKTGLHKLPGGFVIRVRKLDLVDLAVTGYMPLSLVSTLVETGTKLQHPEMLREIEDKELAELHGVLRKVALRAVVEPAVSESGSEETLAVDELGLVNMLSIFTACVDTSGSGTLRPFRKK